MLYVSVVDDVESHIMTTIIVIMDVSVVVVVILYLLYILLSCDRPVTVL